MCLFKGWRGGGIPCLLDLLESDCTDMLQTGLHQPKLTYNISPKLTYNTSPKRTHFSHKMAYINPKLTYNTGPKLTHFSPQMACIDPKLTYNII